MNNNALSVANYFVDLAKRDNKNLSVQKLVKLVYIAYGFGLAAYGKSILDYRIDKVEAWEFGPVIPSVYYSFMHYGNNNIREKATLLVNTSDEDVQIVTPTVEDKHTKIVCDMVWRSYGDCTDSQIISRLHADGTPWWSVYEDGRYNTIPEQNTKRYYSIFLDKCLERDKAYGNV